MDQDPYELTVSEKKNLKSEMYRNYIHSDMKRRMNNAMFEGEMRDAAAVKRKKRVLMFVKITLGAYLVMRLALAAIDFHNSEPPELKVFVPRSNCTEYVFHGWWNNVAECEFYSETQGNCVYVAVGAEGLSHLFCDGKETAQSRNGD
mgnify:CR=1 FL=1